ncbi:Holliday junction branch migration protein RuvA [Castellaniella sp.]|uniref:Holliday junction branch migration protein RuvA n=1 Tax=Castellaniella sp. TaxID=1955812 RepID=UPI002D8071B4|nr:Holliday junction branch migration protein RuvA [Castellaniella sp.]HET8702652.1 Holliday junction branch migration protein RuvA [Castellaniella sp.]
MIGRITGTLIELSPPTICVQAGGLGYEIDVPMSTLYKLPPVGQSVTLHTHLAIREDAHVLYGFATPAERSAFRALIKVSGIGARTALAVLSGLSVEDLADAVEHQESGRLVKVPGIGKKTAERLLLELRDKLGAIPGQVRPDGAPAAAGGSDVLNALQALGYSAAEARRAMGTLPEGLSVSDSIRQALKALARG